MADEARLHELLDVYEQAVAEGDTATAERVKAAYIAERDGTVASSVENSAQPEAAATAPPPQKPKGTVGDGAMEAFLTMLSGAVATPVAGLAGLGVGAFQGADAAARTVEGVQRAMTYSPRTQAGDAELAFIAKPFEKLSQGADSAGDAVLNATGSAGLATATRTLIEGAPDLLGLRMLRGARVGQVQPPRSPNASVNYLRDRGVSVSRMQDNPSWLTRKLNEGADTVFGPDQRLRDRQGGEFNRAVTEEMEMPTDRLDIDTRDTMRQEITDRIDNFARQYDTPMDNQLMNDLGRIEADAMSVLDTAAGPIRNQVSMLLRKGQSGRIDGQASQHSRQLINQLSKNPAYAEFARELRGALDAALERGAPADAAADISLARRQYHQLMQVDDAMRTNAGDFVNPNTLFNVANQRKNRRGGLRELASHGKRVLPDRTPNSGTPQRSAPAALAVGLYQHPAATLQTLGTFGLGRYMNRNPAFGAQAAAAAPAAAVPLYQGGGEAALAESHRAIEAYLQSIGAR